MRFILAIVAFAVAALMIAVGIAQRTILLPPDHLSAEIALDSTTPFVVLSGRTLNRNPGQQTLLVDGSDSPFVAYGRSKDVAAWLDGAEYTRLTFGEDGELRGAVHRAERPSDEPSSEPTPAPTTPAPAASASEDAAEGEDAAGEAGPNPAGSDLWLQEFSGDAARITRMNVPDDVSVIIASDGTKPAPSSIRIVWPRGNATPWAGPLLAGGALVFVAGLVLYLLALRELRRSRGPRRGGGGGGPRMPKLPKSPRYQPTGSLEPPRRGRRAITRSVAATAPLLAGALVLGGCSADYWPQWGAAEPGATASPAASALPKDADDAPPPAVTVPQLEKIVHSIGTTAEKADSARDAELAATRFAGPALLDRKADYALRTPPVSVPADARITLALPQATGAWPRTVVCVVQQRDEPKAAPTVLVMTQASPRENYVVSYTIQLGPDPRVPTLPPASVGDSRVPPDSKLLVLPPNDVASAYADILLKGEESEFFDLFEAQGDELRAATGVEYKKQQKAKFPSTGTLAFSNGPGSGEPVAMATNDLGAIVATSFVEYETAKPTEAGAEVINGEKQKALSGIASSKTGLRATYGYQVLFYVPPGDSHEKIRLLGYSEGLIASQEVK